MYLRGPSTDVDLRQELELLDPEPRPGLIDMRQSDAQIAVLAQRDADELLQRGVAQHLPPRQVGVR